MQYNDDSTFHTAASGADDSITGDADLNNGWFSYVNFVGVVAPPVSPRQPDKESNTDDPAQNRKTNSEQIGSPEAESNESTERHVITLPIDPSRQWRVDEGEEEPAAHHHVDPQQSSPEEHNDDSHPLDPPETSQPAPRGLTRSLKSILSNLQAPTQADSDIIETTPDAESESSQRIELEVACSELMPQAEKRPLSEVLQQVAGEPERPVRNELAVEEDSVDPIPGHSVAAFRWPRVVLRSRERFAEQYAGVANEIQQTAAAGHSLIGFTALRRNMGTSTALLCVARELTDRQLDLTIIDADFAQPQIGQQLGCTPPTTWLNYLRDEAPLPQAFVASVSEPLTVLPMSPTRSVLQDMDVPSRVAATAGKVRFGSSIALIDLAPLILPAEDLDNHGLAAEQELPLAASAPATDQEDKSRQPLLALTHEATLLTRTLGIDCMVLLVDTNKDTPSHILWAQQQLELLGCNLLGTIETST